jgi:hypothetical protein
VEGNLSSPPMLFGFEGNLTGSYFNNDQVKITVKIKHLTFIFQNVTFDLEMYEPQLVNEEYYTSHIKTDDSLKPLPQSCISKI